MNGPTAASPPPSGAPGSGHRHPSMGGIPPQQPGAFTGPNGMNAHQSQMQHQQHQFMNNPQILNAAQIPPQMREYLASLPPELRHQFIQQQQQQQFHPQSQSQSQPQQQQSNQHANAQLFAHMNSLIAARPDQQQLQNNAALRSATAAAAAAAAQSQAQGKPPMQDDPKRQLQAQVHPSQMQSFLQASAQAAAQMQAASSAAAQQNQHQHQPQQQSQPPPPQASQTPFSQNPSHPSPQHQHIAPPSGLNRHMPPLSAMNSTHIPPHLLASAASSSPINLPPNAPQLPPAPAHHLIHPSLSDLSSSGDAVAGPSNPRAAAAATVAAQQAHNRRPSMDQIALMQRLSQMAQKGGLPIQSLFTKTSWMASSEEGEAVPDYTEWDRRNLEMWMQKDLRSVELAKREKIRVRETLEDLAQEMIQAQDWLGPARAVGEYPSQAQFHVRSRKELEKDLARGKRKRRPWLEFTKKQLRKVAKLEECLVPLRIDLEHDGRKCSDTFTWNLNEPLITPDLFAEIMCEDMLLPHDPFHSLIVTSINEQIKQHQEAEESHPRSLFVGSASAVATQMHQQDTYHSTELAHAGLLDSSTGQTKDSDMLSQVDEQDEQEEEDWWDGWRKKVQLCQAIAIGEEVKNIPWHEGADAQDDLAKQVSEPPVIIVGQDELRITIQLDIAVDNTNLRDQFEWDLSDTQNSPEAFAAVYCVDLGLPGEFRTAIAHLIREQLDAHARSLASIRHIRGDQILHDELRTAFHPTLLEVVRSDDVENWTPHLGKLDLVELEHRERERERQSRRQKRGARNNRRNVVTLPDREPLRTSRTILPAPGAVLEVAENTGPDDPASVPTYAIAEPYPLVPVKFEGPPPRMSSPLRRVSRKFDPLTGAAVSSDIGPAAAGLKAKPPGKRRGRPPLDPSKREHIEATPPPDTAGSGAGSPAPGHAGQPKKPVGRPPLIKKPAGWTRLEMTTHENIIDGKWHCTNCGVPEPVAIGRRKGPAGPNTQCAECGKYFMSNKGRLRPCEYTTDPAYHQARQSGFPSGPISTRNASQAPTPAPAVPDSPGGSVFEPDSGDESKPSFLDDSFDASRHTFKQEVDDSVMFPQRKASVSVHPQGAGKGKGIGLGKGRGAGKGLPPFPKMPPTMAQTGESHLPLDHQRLHPHQQSLPPIRLSPNRTNSQLAPASASPPNPESSLTARSALPPGRKRPEAPKWMVDEIAKLHAERPDDRFEIIAKPRASPDEALEWRLKCLDCPGKVYKTGPNATLENFSAHLRFKGHRSAVAERLAST